MVKWKAILFLVVIVILVGWLAAFWIGLPKRTSVAFGSDLYHERYQEAAVMLRPPSALDVDSDGGLILVDKAGRVTNVPKNMLPFKVADGDGGPEHDLRMMALGPSTNGVLDSPPVTLYLSGGGGRITIEAVED